MAFTEFWERFSYFGMLGLLVLFLTAPVRADGFGWSSEDALILYGTYSGLAFCAPVLGGWVANQYWGERRSILIGGWLLAAGHVMLGGPHYLPQLIETSSEIAVRDVLHAAGVPLGHWSLTKAQFGILREAAELHVSGRADIDVVLSLALLAYRMTTFSFFGGLALIIVGTAFIKPTISSIIARLYPANDGARDTGFAIFFMLIYCGSVSANFVAGFLGERVGWHYGFGAAAIGMAFGLACYLWKEKDYLGDLGIDPPGRSAPSLRRAPLDRQAQDRVAVIGIQGLFTVLYAAAFYQKGGLLTLFARENIDRVVHGFEIPVNWTLMVSTICFVVLAPAAGSLWRALEARHRNPSASYKLAAGLAVIGCGYLLMTAAAFEAADRGYSSLTWLFGTYVLFGVADLLVWPNQISLTSKLAPPHLSALCIGGWYITIGIGTWLTGYVAVFARAFSAPRAFLALGGLCFAACILLTSLTPRLIRMMHGAEGQSRQA